MRPKAAVAGLRSALVSEDQSLDLHTRDGLEPRSQLVAYMRVRPKRASLVLGFSVAGRLPE